MATRKPKVSEKFVLFEQAVECFGVGSVYVLPSTVRSVKGDIEGRVCIHIACGGDSNTFLYVQGDAASVVAALGLPVSERGA